MLPFDEGFANGPIRELASLRDHAVPERAGVYVLLARRCVFRYPRHRSAVFYVGRASNLRRRLQTHARFALQAKQDRRLTLYWPMYEYAAAFGCRYTFILPKRRDMVARLESEVLAMFC